MAGIPTPAIGTDPRIGLADRQGVLLAVSTFLVGLGAAAPLAALGLLGVLMLLSRTVDRVITGVVIRRHTRGHREREALIAAATSPWHLLVALGATALAKGCMHTHRTLLPNIVGGGLWSHASAEAVSLGVVPMFHITGMLLGVLSPVYLGSTVVLMPRWYRELDIDLVLDSPVTAIDSKRQMLHTLPGENIHYQKLLIATGASPTCS